MGSRGIHVHVVPLFIANLCARQGWVVKDTSGPITSGRIIEPKAFLDGCGKNVPTGIRSLASPNRK